MMALLLILPDKCQILLTEGEGVENGQNIADVICERLLIIYLT